MHWYWAILRKCNGNAFFAFRCIMSRYHFISSDYGVLSFNGRVDRIFKIRVQQPFLTAKHAKKQKQKTDALLLKICWDFKENYSLCYMFASFSRNACNLRKCLKYCFHFVANHYGKTTAVRCSLQVDRKKTQGKPCITDDSARPRYAWRASICLQTDSLRPFFPRLASHTHTHVQTHALKDNEARLKVVTSIYPANGSWQAPTYT